jgi:hypothetical protein
VEGCGPTCVQKLCVPHLLVLVLVLVPTPVAVSRETA